MSRELRLWKYDISKERFSYLNSFCRQYPEWKKKSNYGLSAVVSDGMPHSHSVGSPTERQAMQNMKFSSNMTMIEETAKEANEYIWKYILKAVTEGATYETMGRVPCGRRQFYESRRKFFYILDLKMP